MSLPGIQSLPVKVTVKSVPDSYLPPSRMQELLEAIPQFTDYELDDTGANVVVNETSAGGTLDGIWVWTHTLQPWPANIMTGYRNNWWQVYTGKPQEIRMFVGSPAEFFDSSGLGLEYATWAGWALCNGQHAVNLQNYFTAPGYRYDGVWWVTQVLPGSDTYYNIGGGATFYKTLTLAYMPDLRLDVNATDFFKYGPGGVYGSGGLFIGVAPGIQDVSGPNKAVYNYPIDQNPYMVSVALNLAPPYIAVGFAEFIGYQ